MKYSDAKILKDTNTIFELYGNMVFELSGSWNRPATQPLFMRLIKCFDDRRSDRLWLKILEECLRVTNPIESE
jgi:hypothetical protein